MVIVGSATPGELTFLEDEEPSDSAPAPEDDDFDLDDFDDASDVPGGQASTFEVADVPTGVLNVPSNIAPVPSEQPATMGSFFF